jgi:anti-sigma B factor antagonist
MLNIEVEKTQGVALVKCAGRLVRGEEVRALKNAVVSEADTRMIVLDLSEVSALDANGLTALVTLHHWTVGRGIQLRVVNPSPFVREMLERTHLQGVFDVSSFEHALWVLGDCRHIRQAATV